MSLSNRSDSRFALSSPIQNNNGDITFGIPKKFDFLDRNKLDQSDILSHVVTIDQEGKWDVIADDLYGNQDLYWILIIFNNIENPLLGPRNQEIIQYPSPEIVFAEL